MKINSRTMEISFPQGKVQDKINKPLQRSYRCQGDNSKNSNESDRKTFLNSTGSSPSSSKLPAFTNKSIERIKLKAKFDYHLSTIRL